MCSLLTAFDPSISGSVASVALSVAPPQRFASENAASFPGVPDPVAAPVAQRGWLHGFFAFLGVAARPSDEQG